jgi:SAM-dependent methyltransferase
MGAVNSEIQEYPLIVQKELELWFQSALGRSLLANQRAVIAKKIHKVFGFHQAEIGVSHRIPVGNPSSLGHKFYVLPSWEPDLPKNSIISSSGEIALDHDIVDLVILHHTLDFSVDPHQSLREAARILKSSGNLLIVGFNPHSLWGLKRLFSTRKKSPWNMKFIAGRRVEDWLNLLDFRVSGVETHFYGLPFNHQGLMNQSIWLNNVLNEKVPLGAYYTILAQKQSGAKIKALPKWRDNAKVVGLPIANRFNNKDKIKMK